MGMRTYKVTFADGDYLVTGFNGNLEDARRYYVGAEFNMGRGGNDGPMTKGVEVVEANGVNHGKDGDE